jgi:transcriptional regulator with XRE-family HTH domain
VPRHEHRSHSDHVASSGDARPPLSPLPDLDDHEMRSLVGTRLKAVRLERGMTMREVSEASGVTRGFISQVENGHVMPSVSTLIGMCNALRCHVGDLFDSTQRVGTVIHPADRTTYRYPETGIRDEILTPRKGTFEVILSQIDPGGGTGDAYTHGSQVEFVFVQRGTVQITVGSEHFVLQSGDALTFDGSMPHGIRNDEAHAADVIWVVAPATY